VFAKFGFDWDKSKLEEADRGVDGLVHNLNAVAGVLAGGAIVEGIKRFAEQLDVFDDLSAQTHIATDQLQELGYAAKISGSSAEEMFAALSLLQKGLGRADSATSPQAKALKTLGVATKDAAGNVRDLDSLLPDIYENFAGLKTQADKAEVAVALFGRAGVKLIPTLERGKEGFEAIHDEIEAFGGVVGEDTIAQAGEFRDNLVRLDTAFFALKGRLAAAVFPQLSKIVTVFGHGVGRIADFVKQTTLAQNATTALGLALSGKLAGALAPYVGKGLKFAGIMGAIDDLLAFLDGRGSLIGEWLDIAFGPGSQENVRTWVNASIAEFARYSASAKETFAVIEDDNASLWSKALASMAGMLRDGARGFPIFVNSLRVSMAQLDVDWSMWVLGLENRWNAFISNLALPDFVKSTLQIDTSGAAEDAQAHQHRLAKVRNDLEAAHLGQESPQLGTPGRTERVGRTVSAAESAAFSVSAKAPTLLIPGADTIGPVRPGVEGRATIAPPTVENRSASTNFVQINTPITVQVPTGTSAQVIKQAGAAAVSAIQGERRAALQALQAVAPTPGTP
jgi:hypothetical protein